MTSMMTMKDGLFAFVCCQKEPMAGLVVRGNKIPRISPK